MHDPSANASETAGQHPKVIFFFFLSLLNRTYRITDGK